MIRENIGPGIDRHSWPNGLRLVTEPVPGARTVALGLWIAAGSRLEPPPKHGVAHLLEHMFFKGTADHDAESLALAMNALGGHFNAFTSQETICLHTRVIDEHFERALELLVGQLRRSLFDDGELERERSVILEEIKLTNDTPDDLIHDLFQESLWGEHGLGRSVLGTPETVSALRRGDLLAFMEHEFLPSRLVVAIAGAVDPIRAAALVEALLGDLVERNGGGTPLVPPIPGHAVCHTHRSTEQMHFCLGGDAPNRLDESRYAFNLLNSILGGGTSSRVFQEIRERRGLAYAIGSFLEGFQDAGCFGISGGTSPGALPEVLGCCRAEIDRVCREPVSPAELRNAKDQMRAHLLLSLESMNHRMSRLAELEIHFGRHIPLEETLARIEAVTADDILDVARRHLAEGPRVITTLGPGA